MRIVALSAAGFCLLVSVGEIVVLFILPATSVSLVRSGAGSTSAAAQGWGMLLLLVLALTAAAGVLFSLKRAGSVTLSTQVGTLTGAASFVAIADYAVSRYLGWFGPRDIPWLNVTAVVVAASYLAVWRQRRRRG